MQASTEVRGIGPFSQCVCYVSSLLGLLWFSKEKSNGQLRILKTIRNSLLEWAEDIVL